MTMSRYYLPVALGVLFHAPVLAQPVTTKPAVSVKADNGTFVAVSISGTGFGSGAPGSYVEIAPGTGSRFTVPFNDPSVTFWQDDQIVIQLATTIHPRKVRVRIAGLWSKPTRVHSYRLTIYDAPGLKLGYVHAAGGRLWIHSEPIQYHLLLDSPGDFFGPLYFPHGAIPDPFPRPFWDNCSIQEGVCAHRLLSMGGEGITVDEYGRAWFTHLGGIPERVPSFSPNHSRLVMYDPKTHKVRMYYPPGDRNSVAGIAWDSRNKLIWYVNSRFQSMDPLMVLRGVPARLTTFDPERVRYDEFDNYTAPYNQATTTSFDYVTTATCDPYAGGGNRCSNKPERECLTQHDCVLVNRVRMGPRPTQLTPDDATYFYEYPLEGVDVPFGIGVARDGTVYFSSLGNPKADNVTLPGGGYGGRSIGVLNPSTGSLQMIPLPSTPHGGTPNPGQVRVARNGDVFVALAVSKAVAHLRPSAIAESPTGCTTLTPSIPECAIVDSPDQDPVNPHRFCENPCVSVAYDTSAWVSCPGCDLPQPIGYDAIALEGSRTVWNSRGYTRFRGRRVERVYFPPITKLYPSPNADGGEQCVAALNFNMGGLGERVTFDNDTRTAWSKSECGKRIYSLRRD